MFTVYQMDGVIFYPLQIGSELTYVHSEASNGRNDFLFHSKYFHISNMEPLKSSVLVFLPAPHKYNKCYAVYSNLQKDMAYKRKLCINYLQL